MLEKKIRAQHFAILNDFPIFTTTNRGKPLIYLDSAASAQKPQQVIDAIANFYAYDYANIHRGIYELSERATNLFESSRETVAKFIHAQSPQEIIFVRGTTEGINLVAQSYARNFLQAGDEILVSELEHHANIVPWYLLSQQIGIKIKIIPIHDNGAIDLTAYKKLFTPRTKFVALSHVSNALGTILPIKEMIAYAHEQDALVLIDGAQAVPHMPVSVSELDCDFYAFSAHKLYGPTGVGVLYGKKALLDRMPPYQGGGDMIETVSFADITFAHTPQKFEAGTPDIANVVALKTALDYLNNIGMQAIYEHEQSLLHDAEKKLKQIPGLRILGEAKPKVGVISFLIDDIHPHDIGTVLDHEGIAIRAGHHCAMPLMQRLQVPATVRASFGVYTTHADIDALVAALKKAKRLFA